MAKFLKCTPEKIWSNGVTDTRWLVNVDYITTIVAGAEYDEEGNDVFLVYADEPMWEGQDGRVNTYITDSIRQNIVEI